MCPDVSCFCLSRLPPGRNDVSCQVPRFSFFTRYKMDQSGHQKGHQNGHQHSTTYNLQFTLDFEMSLSILPPRHRVEEVAQPSLVDLGGSSGISLWLDNP